MKKKQIQLALIALLVAAFCSEAALAQTRIRFARGRTSATVSGTIGGGGQRSYVLGARYGQVLSGNVSSRNGCVKFTEGSTSTSFITESGNNYLSLTNYCSRATRFTMTVSINYGSD